MPAGFPFHLSFCSGVESLSFSFRPRSHRAQHQHRNIDCKKVVRGLGGCWVGFDREGNMVGNTKRYIECSYRVTLASPGVIFEKYYL